VHVDEATYRRLVDRFEFREPLIIHLKGKGNTPVYQIVGPRNAPSPTGAAVSSGAPA
jgi:hypothetical protein